MNEHDIFTSVLVEVFETELDGLTAEITLDREHEFSDKFDRKMRKLIKRRSRSYFSLICTAGRRAACIAVIVLLLLANPFTVNAVKQRILGFLKEDHSDHAELTVDIDDSAAGAVDFSEIRRIVIEKHGILHRFLRNEWINWIRKCPRDSPNLVACERHPSIPPSLTESCQPHPEDRI